MSENIGDPETISKKFMNLDSEINSFLHTIGEINQMRETVKEFPNKLKQTEIELENRKKKLDNLMSSTDNLLVNFEEKSKGIIFDLERKTDDIAGEVKSSISQFESLFRNSRSHLQDYERENIDKLLKKHEELNDSCKSLKKQVEDNVQSINILKNSYVAVSGIFEKLEVSFGEMKKNMLDLQRRPYEVENKTVEMEERLTALIEENHASQKIFMWVLFVVVFAGIAFSFSVFYLQ